MKIDNEQMKVLSQYERYMETAVRANWASYPGVRAITELESIYAAVTGTQRNTNKSCGTCILHLLQDVGKLYFKQKEENEVVKVTIKEKKTTRKRQ